MNHITIFACESQPIVLQGLEKVLTGHDDLEYLGCATTLTETLNAIRERQPDVLLVDPFTGLKSVFQFLSDAKAAAPNCHPVLWVTDLPETDSFRALQFGARGILKKTLSVDSLLECVRTVGQGGVWIEGTSEEPPTPFDRRTAPRLTQREREIVQQVCAGLKNKEIGQTLSITPGTVKVHLMHIFEKTGVKDRFELALHGRRLLGLDRIEPPIERHELHRSSTA